MATKQGNRRLQATIYFFAVQMIQISSKGTPIQLFVRITRSVKKKVNQYIYGMLKSGMEYQLPAVENVGENI